MSELTRVLSRIGFGEAIDILTVSLVFYVVLRLVRGERTTVPQRGFVLLVLASVFIYFAAVTFDLEALQFIIERLGIVVVLMIIVIFQSDLRRGLAELGRLRIVRSLFSRPDVGLAEVARGAIDMAQRRTGALIAIERDVPLRTWIDRGTPIGAVIRAETLRTIFTVPAPLHDGAVVIQGERIAAAGCILPLTTNETLGQELGTRHRAALGLSEETDAIVVVVSEETGKISIAIDGELRRSVEPSDLNDLLAELVGEKQEKKEKREKPEEP